MSNVVNLDDYRPNNLEKDGVVNRPRFKNVLKGMMVGAVTPNAVEHLLQAHENTARAYVEHLFARFDSGDWGDVCEEDSEMNEKSVSDGSMVMGVYPLHQSKPDVKVWLVLDRGHETATVLMPEDY